MGLLVLGMHRAGTSVATTALGAVIKDAELPHDCAESASDTHGPAGRAESSALTGVNDIVLSQLGGSWDHPPEPGPHWVEGLLASAKLTRQARSVFGRTFKTAEWIWKDPRTCLTAPYWLRLLGNLDAIVITFRHPLEVADSVAGSSGDVSRIGALNLWQRYMDSAVRAAQGYPTLVTGYATLLDAPDRWLRQVTQLADHTALDLVDDPGSRMARVPDVSLRHFGRGADDLTGVSGLSRVLFAGLLSMEGFHDKFLT